MLTSQFSTRLRRLQPQVYVRHDFCDPTTGLALDANTGNPIGGFTSDTPPAFIGDLVLFFHDGTLAGVDIPSGQQLWSFAGDGDLTSAPLIVNQTTYIGSPFAIEVISLAEWGLLVRSLKACMRPRAG